MRRDLNPISFSFAVNIHDAKSSEGEAVFSLELAKERRDRQLRTVELHVEVADFVRRTGRHVRSRLRCFRRSWPFDAVGSHVLVDALYRSARAFEEATPIFRMRREYLQ